MQMKNKILASLTALCAALVLVGGFSVTAYAQTPTEETDDSGVIVETEPQPLTPEGNMTLAEAIKADKERGKEKPSIRAQLKADKERTGKKKNAKQKSQDLERS